MLLLCLEVAEWEEVNEMSAVYSTQGLRPNNEDRAVTKKLVGWDPKIEADARNKEDVVHIFAILDGHGGEVRHKSVVISVVIYY